jgi:restriction endonuclease S subunit
MELMTKQGFKQTEVGLIPEDWEVKKLGELTELITKGTTPTSIGKEFKNHGIRFIKAESIDKTGNIINDKVAFIDAETHGLLGRSKMKKDDILFTIAGVLGRIGMINEDNLPANTNQAVAIVRLKKSLNLFVPFFFHILRTNAIEKHIESISVQGAQANFSLTDVSNIPLSIPKSLEEQKAIATALSDVDALIANLDKLIVKKKAIKQGAMQQLLTPPHKGGKRLPGFSGGWEQKSINELSKTFTKQTGFDYSNHIKPTLIDKKQRGHLPFIQNKDFQGHSVNFDTDYYIPQDVAVRFPMILLNERCLMISISGSIGKVGVFNNKQMAFIGGAVSVGKFHNPDYLDWVMNYLQSEAGQNMMLKDVKAGSHQNLILDDIRKMIIPMPKLDEQKAVNQILIDMEAEILVLESKKAKYQDIKQGMMQELLTGKTRLI